MRVFLDTNIIVDFYAQREGHYHAAALIMTLAWKGEIELIVSSITFVNAFFLLRKDYSADELYEKMDVLASMCEISVVDGEKIKDALKMGERDFEDSVQWLSANSCNADVIVTRDKHFRDYQGNIKTPDQFLDDYFDN